MTTSLANKAIAADGLVGRAGRSLWRPQLNASTLAGQVPSSQSDAVLLHTAARRYCIEAHAERCAAYEALCARGGDRDADGGYTPDARRTFPRYNVLAAILEAVEQIPIETLGTADQTRERLIAAHSANNAFTVPPQDDLELAAMQAERDAFVQFVGTLSLASLASVLPLPYRRVLNPQESDEIWSQLAQRWQIGDDYWFPLEETSVRDLVAWHADAFRAALPADTLRSVLQDRSIKRFWEMREYGTEYEHEASSFDPFYNGAEGYWSSTGLDWILYASHEGTMTAGGWLVGDLKKRWSTWKDHVWQGPDWVATDGAG